MDKHSKPPKLMDRVRATLRVKRYSPRTEKTYFYWIRYFIRFHGVRHPAGMGGAAEGTKSGMLLVSGSPHG